MAPASPLLLIISSPSGAGKTTLTARLLERISGLRFSISHTTRSPRPNEQDGREYHFVDTGTFKRMIEADAFLEWAEVHGNLYGTSRSELSCVPDAPGILFDIDHQGARQIKSARPDAVGIFILPPSMEVLLERLRGRRSEDEATLLRRFGAAKEEIAHYGLFDYLIVNDSLNEATDRLVGIILAEQARRARAARFAEELLTRGRDSHQI
jgi:guanylate kinase